MYSMCYLCYSVKLSVNVEINSFMLALIKLSAANFSSDWVCNIVACSLFVEMDCLGAEI